MGDEEAATTTTAAAAAAEAHRQTQETRTEERPRAGAAADGTNSTPSHDDDDDDDSSSSSSEHGPRPAAAAAGAADAAMDRKQTTLSDLPVEVLALIARGLVPAPPSTAFPPPPPPPPEEEEEHSLSAALSQSHARLPSLAYRRDLLSLARVSRACAAAALPVLYAVLLLRRTRQVALLADLFRPSRTHAANFFAMCVTDLYLTPYDGLLEANDRSNDAEHWDANVRALFNAARRIEHVSLTTMSSGTALQNFLHPKTLARPAEVTIHDLSAASDLGGLDLRPLSAVTHLHLVNMRPKRALLDFLHGFDGSGAEHALGTHPLTHLRLSALGGGTFEFLSEYIELREQAMGRWQPSANGHARGHFDASSSARTQDGTRTRARTSDDVHPNTRGLRFGQRQVWVHQSLYNLAADADLLPNLRLVQIEISAEPALPAPSQPMERESPTVTLLDSPASTAASTGPSPFSSTGGLGAPFEQFTPAAAPGTLATIDFPSDVPLSEAEAAEWAAQEHEVRAAEERQRTAHRDAYWLRVRESKEALVRLFREARRDAGLDPAELEVRVVLARPGGWNNAQAQAEFAAAAFSRARRAARGSRTLLALPLFSEVGGGGAGVASSSCWDDEDVFELAARRPDLTFRNNGSPFAGFADKAASTDASPARRRNPAWWTGQLPRLNAGGSS